MTTRGRGTAGTDTTTRSTRLDLLPYYSLVSVADPRIQLDSDHSDGSGTGIFVIQIFVNENKILSDTGSPHILAEFIITTGSGIGFFFCVILNVKFGIKINLEK